MKNLTESEEKLLDALQDARLETTKLADKCMQLQATNKQLLEALEKIANRTQDTKLLWWQKLAREAITNAKQVMGDK